MSGNTEEDAREAGLNSSRALIAGGLRSKVRVERKRLQVDVDARLFEFLRLLRTRMGISLRQVVEDLAVLAVREGEEAIDLLREAHTWWILGREPRTRSRIATSRKRNKEKSEKAKAARVARRAARDAASAARDAEAAELRAALSPDPTICDPTLLDGGESYFDDDDDEPFTYK